ncbi:MAG TPA: lipid II flippase MurJ [Candidatus Acidoferrales bacterium]|nr:lipid II flippase MurJ [Candidatus Acidoferrales bacterium]
MNPTPTSTAALYAERILTRAVDSPLVRGGLTIVAGVLTGNLLGFVRVAVIAYLLGTRSHADSLAVALGPLDTLNSVILNSIVFAFVPMLTAARDEERTALFLKLSRGFVWVCSAIAATVIIAAPWLMRLLAPGLDPAYFGTSVNVLRILALSTPATGVGAVHCALLYTDRRFGPAAFYQAAINVFTIAGALTLWRFIGVYAFPAGYTAGAAAQLAVVWFAARSGLNTASVPQSTKPWSEILTKPAFFVVYAAALGLNIVFTRAYATHAGPGMAAALDYCMRGVAVPLALLVNPISNSLLPEISRLRSIFRLKEALRLIDRTIAITGLLAMVGCGFAMAFREPAIRIMFQRGSFTAESTQLVSAAFLTLAPSLIGWSLIEILARSLFALDRRWPAVIAAMVPVVVNASISVRLGPDRPENIGIGSSAGLFAGFLVLFTMAHVTRKRWLAQG